MDFSRQTYASGNCDCIVQLALLGSHETGKTSILKRFIIDRYDEDIESTTETACVCKFVERRGKRVMANIWDTPGHTKFGSFTTGVFRGFDGCIVVYDISNRDSFRDVDMWINKLSIMTQCSSPVLILANKADLEHKRVVSTEEGKQLASKYAASFLECSAKYSTDIRETFDNIISKIALKKISNRTLARRGWNCVLL